MAPTEGRVAKPERRWGCRRGTPASSYFIIFYISIIKPIKGAVSDDDVCVFVCLQVHGQMAAATCGSPG